MSAAPSPTAPTEPARTGPSRGVQPSADQRLYFLDLLRIVAFVTVLVGHKFQPALQAWGQDNANFLMLTYQIYLFFC